ncbi:MAG TPA: hypothetical protein DD440_02010 [Porticoccaceae bacterium]|jgi:hypothetical protein|nr:hypothetical protein [Porticoccaceae bacterium]|tara:strand:- start:125 stop:631 length:507 start_codon:yes stop_codon:yes gene_type:complete
MNNMRIKSLTPHEIEEELRLRYVTSICDMQLNYARRRNSNENATRLQQWMRSTFQKDAFAWAVVHAKSVKLPASQSDIMAQTKITRQSVSLMVQHCLAEGWIEVFCDDKKIDAEHIKYCKGTLKYWAGEEMMQLVDAFVERHIETTEGTFMNKNWDDLMAIRQVRRVL